MDMVSIGKFISELRKQQGLTQEQLGEKIGVTNKTVSRWETGTYLPPADALLTMSGLFGVSINEILSGKRLSDAEYKNAAEKNLVQAVANSSFSVKEKTDYYRKKWLKEHIADMVFMGICIIAIAAAGFIFREPLISYAAFPALIICHCIRHNMMMTYVENHVYGENDKDSF